MWKPEQRRQQRMKRRPGTTQVDAETGATAATRNEKATVAEKTPKAEAGTTTATWAA